ncbi:hypothetical protein QVD17_35762 [Tagetes erecta]|uniref:Uncharacterized protein n=1 Tax=Tagetes erecta TaxID=13708 RepID=A0AAD8JT96_TARER|nr:hypothetical protein QVD17_35762 [Tagetes erecta]
MDDLHSTHSLSSDPEKVSPTLSNATSAFAPAQATSSKGRIGLNFNYKNAIHYNVSTTNCSARSSTTPSLSHPVVNVSNAQPRVAAAGADFIGTAATQAMFVSIVERCFGMRNESFPYVVGGGKAILPFLSHISRMSTLEASGATNHTMSGDEHPAEANQKPKRFVD